MKFLRALIAVSLAFIITVEPVAASGLVGAGFHPRPPLNEMSFNSQAVVSFLNFFNRLPMFRQVQSRISRWIPQIDEKATLEVQIWWPQPREAGEMGAGKRWDGRLRISWPTKLSMPSAPILMQSRLVSSGLSRQENYDRERRLYTKYKNRLPEDMTATERAVLELYFGEEKILLNRIAERLDLTQTQALVHRENGIRVLMRLPLREAAGARGPDSIRRQSIDKLFLREASLSLISALNLKSIGDLLQFTQQEIAETFWVHQKGREAVADVLSAIRPLGLDLPEKRDGRLFWDYWDAVRKESEIPSGLKVVCLASSGMVSDALHATNGQDIVLVDSGAWGGRHRLTAGEKQRIIEHGYIGGDLAREAGLREVLLSDLERLGISREAVSIVPRDNAWRFSFMWAAPGEEPVIRHIEVYPEWDIVTQGPPPGAQGAQILFQKASDQLPEEYEKYLPAFLDVMDENGWTLTDDAVNGAGYVSVPRIKGYAFSPIHTRSQLLAGLKPLRRAVRDYPWIFRDPVGYGWDLQVRRYARRRFSSLKAGSSFLAIPLIALGFLSSPLWFIPAVIVGLGLHPLLNGMPIRRWFPRVEERGTLTINLMPERSPAGAPGSDPGWDGKVRISWPTKISWPGAPMRMDNAQSDGHTSQAPLDHIEAQIERIPIGEAKAYLKEGKVMPGKYLIRINGQNRYLQEDLWHFFSATTGEHIKPADDRALVYIAASSLLLDQLMMEFPSDEVLASMGRFPDIPIFPQLKVRLEYFNSEVRVYVNGHPFYKFDRSDISKNEYLAANETSYSAGLQLASLPLYLDPELGPKFRDVPEADLFKILPRDLRTGGTTVGAAGFWTWIGLKSVVWMGFWEACITTAASFHSIFDHWLNGGYGLTDSLSHQVMALSWSVAPVVGGLLLALFIAHFVTGVAQPDGRGPPVRWQFWLSVRATGIAGSSFLAIPFAALGFLSSPFWFIPAFIIGLGLHPLINAFKARHAQLEQALRRFFTRGLSMKSLQLKRPVDGHERVARGEMWTVDLKRYQADLDWAENYRLRDLEQEFHQDNDKNVGHTVEQYVQRDESPADVVLATNAPQEYWVQNNTFLIHEGRYVLPTRGRIDLHQRFVRLEAREAGTEVPAVVPPHGRYHIFSLDPDKPGIFEIELDAQGVPLSPPPVREGFVAPLLKLNGTEALDGQTGIRFGQKPKFSGDDVEWGPDKRQAYTVFGYDDNNRVVILHFHGTTDDPELSDPNLYEVMQLPEVRRLKHVVLGGTSADVQRYSPLMDQPFVWSRARAGSLLEKAIGSPRGRRMAAGLRFTRRAPMRQALGLRPEPPVLLLERLRVLAARVSLPASVVDALGRDIHMQADLLSNPYRVEDHRSFGRLLIRFALLGLIVLPEGDLEFKIPAWGNLPVADQEQLFAALIEIHRTAPSPRAVSLVSPLVLGAPVQLALTPLKEMPVERFLSSAQTQAYAEKHRLEGGLHTVTAGRGLAGQTRRELVEKSRILMEYDIMPGVDRLDVLGDLRADPKNDGYPIIFLLDHRTHQAMAAAAAGANILTGSGWTAAQIREVQERYPHVRIVPEVASSADNHAAIEAEVQKGAKGVLGKPHKAWEEAMSQADASRPDLLLIVAQGVFETVVGGVLERYSRVVAACGFNAKTPSEFRAQAKRYASARGQHLTPEQQVAEYEFLRAEGRTRGSTTIKKVTLRSWKGLTMEDQEAVLKKVIAQQQKDDVSRAVVLLSPLRAGRPLRIAFVPREFQADPRNPAGTLIRMYLWQRRTIDAVLGFFFKSFRDPKTIQDRTWRVPGRPWQKITSTVNLAIGFKPGGGKPATECTLCNSVIRTKWPSELWVRMGATLGYFNPFSVDPARPGQSWISQSLAAVLTWGGSDDATNHVSQAEIYKVQYLRELRSNWMRLNASPLFAWLRKYRLIMNGWGYGKPDVHGGASQDHVHGQLFRHVFPSEKVPVDWVPEMPRGSSIRVGLVSALPGQETDGSRDVVMVAFEAQGQYLAGLDEAVSNTVANIVAEKDSFNLMYFEVRPQSAAEWIGYFLRLLGLGPWLSQKYSPRIRILLTGRIKAVPLSGTPLGGFQTPGLENLIAGSPWRYYNFSVAQLAEYEALPKLADQIDLLNRWLAEGAIKRYSDEMLFENFREDLQQALYSRAQAEALIRRYIEELSRTSSRPPGTMGRDRIAA